MTYLLPSTPSYPKRVRRYLAGLGADAPVAPVRSVPVVSTPVEPTSASSTTTDQTTEGAPSRGVVRGVGVTPLPGSTTTTDQNSDGTPQQGMCLVTSGPSTGSVTSIVPCANVGNNTGGTVQPVDSAVPSTPATPVPSNYPINEPYYASDGSVWVWNSVSSEWQEEQAPGSVATTSTGYVTAASSPAAVGSGSFTVGLSSVSYQVVLQNGAYYALNSSGQAIAGPFYSVPTSSQVQSAYLSGGASTAAASYGSSIASPVPAGYPTSEPYYDAYGDVWTYNATTGQWVETGTSSYGASAISPVPAGYPTTEPYYDTENDTVWTYNATSGQWMETSSAYGATGYQAPGTSPVPAGYPITQPYYASDGSVWNYNPTTGTWVETELPGTAAASLATQYGGAATGASAAPSTTNVNTAPSGPSDYQSVIDWFDQSTLISGVKNIWVIGIGLLAYTWLKNRRRG